MILVLLGAAALVILVGLASLLTARAPAVSHAIGGLGIAAASAAGMAAAVTGLALGDASSLALRWNPVIGASFSVGFDSLTGFFLLAIFGVSAACAVFGWGYLSRGPHRRGTGAHWFFYGLLVASMALVVLARNGVLFLVAWEVMSLASWQLVTLEHEREETRAAGVTYLVATQIGTAFLLVMFLFMGGPADSAAPGGTGAFLDFSRLSAAGSAASVVFLLALIGFGTKAGIVPLHVWLPEAHPAAPSHVSALMSGVMIKTGIYGIVRVLLLLGSPPAWWGWTLLLVGAVSGVTGVLFALAQHDIKRLLAYHSVENIGIICLGLGIGMLGQSYGSPAVAMLGFAGGLLHVLNHAIFKSLLFMGAGSAAQAAGTREMDRLGGLARRMPLTALGFVVGAAAISGLPPLNGFVSELLVFLGAFRAAAGGFGFGAAAGPVAEATGSGLGAAAGVTAASLALIGGLAVACFTKAFGISFLGEPRTPAAAAAKEAGASMTVPVLLAAAACAAIGILGYLALDLVAPLAAVVSRAGAGDAAAVIAQAGPGLLKVTVAGGILVLLAAGLAGLRAALLSRRSVRAAGTWDCGYALPDARMQNPPPAAQYTSSSFAQPLVSMFRFPLGTHRRWTPIREPFPVKAEFETHTPDLFAQGLFRPAFAGIASLFSRLRWLQHGRLQLYVLYVAATLLVVLVWKLT